MMHDMSWEQRKNIYITMLPNKASVAGGWYLGVPKFSAAPEVGLEIIKLMTSKYAESERLRLGVGLPTRREFYRKASSINDDRISPYFCVDIKKIAELLIGKAENRFRRSDFACYTTISKVLSFAFSGEYCCSST